MTNRKGMIILAVVAYTFFLLWEAPAQRVFSFLAKGVATPAGLLQCQNMQGTWHEGVALDGQLGRVQFKEFHWTFRPWGLLTGSLSAFISAQTEYGSVAALLNRGIRTLSLQELEASIDVAALKPLTKATGFQLGGKVLGSMTNLAIRQGRITAAQGKWAWNDAAIISPMQNQLGTITVDLMTKSNETRATIGDKGGPLQLEGLFVLPVDGRYNLTAKLAARQSEELKDLISSLAFLGKMKEDGFLHLSWNGVLPPLLP
jgi:hypothetical protein